MTSEAVTQLYSDAFFADPYPLLAKLRRTDPVLWSERAKAFIITRYDDCVAILNDAERFADTADDGEPITVRTPAEHIQYRSLLSSALTPTFVSELEPRVQNETKCLLDELASRDEWDLITSLVNPLTTRALADTLGVPHTDRALFEGWATDWSEALLDGADSEKYVRYRRASTEVVAYFGYRLAVPDGLLQRLSSTGMAPANILSLCTVMMVAARELVAGLVGNTVHALLLHAVRPPQDRIDHVIEESLRWDAPVLGQARVSRTNIELRGVRIPNGSTVLVMLGAANRDPTVFAAPDEFDITRKNAPQHLAFGRGIHSCPGAAMARLEVRAVLRTLLDRFPDIQLSTAHPPRRRAGGRLQNLRAFQSLPVHTGSRR